MARKPSQRASREQQVEELNLTPIMDMVTTIMFFLLMFANVIPLVIIDAPLPKIAETAEEVKIAKQADNKLELTVRVTRTTVVVSSSFGNQSFVVDAEKRVPSELFHNYLVGLHAKMPKAKEITLMPEDDVPYEVLVNVMDAARELTSKDPGYQPVPPEIAQKPESANFNRLFPEVSIGGV